MATPSPFRLPSDARPTRYSLTLTVDLEGFSFKGEEIIDIEVAAPTTQITINAAELQIAGAQIVPTGGVTQSATSIDLDETHETVSFSFGDTIPRGDAKLSIQFSGTLNDQLRGFYRSQYADGQGQQRLIATTQFEATDARRAFPCWDEPDIKAIFDVTLIVPADLAAISNTNVEGETPLPSGMKAVRFAQTPKMSTYLLAFIVGDFASVESTAANGTVVRVWATRGSEEQGRFALETSVGLLAYLNDYFGIVYPLSKLDHIAIPDFASGAMENWGAITYRETALLYDPANSAANTRQRIAEVVAHEMAHMWFGDLVTMEWWDDLWLNESFASWMGTKAVDHLFRDWHMWTQFIYEDTNVGLNLDGLRASHPIEAKVRNPAEIRELFDAISYRKGAAILHMLEEMLGAETFRDGLRAYLAAHQYANARTEHLWAALEAASARPVTAIMDSWVKQTGYPLLQVEAERGDSEVRLNLSQRRFLYDHLLSEDDEDQTTWQVPISVITARSAETAAQLMDGPRASVSLRNDPPSHPLDWIKVNAGETGFFRVNYSPAEWDRLGSAVKTLELPAADRLGLQNDAFALMRAGFIPAIIYLSLIEAYTDEDDVSVWSDLSGNLRSLEALLLDAPFLSRFNAFARSLFSGIIQRVGWDARPGELHLDSLLRSTVLGQAGSYGDRDILVEAEKRFARLTGDFGSLHPDIRGTVYNLAAEQGDRSTYDRLWDLEKRANLHEERMRLLGALTRFRQPELIQETLERSLSPEVRSQDTPMVVVSAAANRHGRDLTWQWAKDNWAELDRRYARGGFAIMRLVAITGNFATLKRAQEVEEFFEAHPVPAAKRTVWQSLERIRLNVKWIETNQTQLASWFADRSTA